MKTLSGLTLLTLIALTPPPALAGEVSKIQGNKVVIQLSDDEYVRLRQRLAISHPDTGAKIGLIEIIRKRGKKAVGKLVRGRARIGGLTDPARGPLELSDDSENNRDDSRLSRQDDGYDSEGSPYENPRSQRNPRSRAPASADDGTDNPFNHTDEVDFPEPPTTKRMALWGFGIGISPTTIKINDGNTSNTLKGYNFIARVAYDRPLKKNFGLLLGVGLLPIGGTQADDDLGVAKMEANYLTFEGNLRLNLTGKSSDGLWVGGGINYLRATSSPSSNVVDPSSMGSRMLFQINGGWNTSMGSEYIMYRADMLMHPSSSSSLRAVNVTQYVLSATYFFN